jgi:hypothetical protein
MSEAGAASALARVTWSSSGTIGSVPFVIPPPVAAVIAKRLEELSATR